MQETNCRVRPVDCTHRNDAKALSLAGCLEGHREKVTGVSWCAEPRLLASCSGDKSVRIWDISSMSCVLIKSDLHDRLITSLSCCPRSNRIATSSWDAHVKIWDVALDSVTTFESHSEQVTRNMLRWLGPDWLLPHFLFL
jgi:WD40 repeat protein